MSNIGDNGGDDAEPQQRVRQNCAKQKVREANSGKNSGEGDCGCGNEQ